MCAAACAIKQFYFVCRTEELHWAYAPCTSWLVPASSNPAASVTVFICEATHATNKSYIHTAAPPPVSFPEIVLRCTRFLVEVFQFGALHLLILIYSGKTANNKQILIWTNVDGYTCSTTRYTKCFNEWVLFSTYVKLNMFRTSSVHHQERFLQAVFADLVCGNMCTTQHIQPLWSWGPKHVELT